jgi:chitinase
MLIYDNGFVSLMRIFLHSLLFVLLPFLGQGAIPTFEYRAGQTHYTLVGHDPAKGGTTTVAVVVAPISLSFTGPNGGTVKLDATPDVTALLGSPVFSSFRFPAGGETQFADALLRATFPGARDWHTLLGHPQVLKTITIQIPAASGYTLSSRKDAGMAAVVDIEYVQRELSRQIGRQEGKLVIALTHNASYYTEGDATLCCSWGTHGVDSNTGNYFLLGSYLSGAPSVIVDRDVQPLTEQLAEFVYDPQHDPLSRKHDATTPGNHFPAWMRPALAPADDLGRCGGDGVATPYFLLEPTDSNHKNNFPVSNSFVAETRSGPYHLQNVALLHWYLGGSSLGSLNSFPDAHILTKQAEPCAARSRRRSALQPTAAPHARTGAANGHELIGYWTGYGSELPAQAISPQWDVVIVAFATPDNKSQGTLHFNLPAGLSPEQLKSQIAYLKQQRKKVMISLGGGGQFFKMDDAKSLPNFVSSVTQIVTEFGFEGIDIDFESPSMDLRAGDTDFKHPRTPSIVHLIAGLRQLREHFGPGFLISLVPEGTQIPAGHRTYGGQFGSYLPIAYGIRDILSFMDVQDYNTPPLEGLDGEIYQSGVVDYHAAMTELVLRGFSVAGPGRAAFPALTQEKVAVGFLVGETTYDVVAQAMRYLITGKVPANSRYRLVQSGGYPGMIGAMFWTIDDDRRNNYEFSNTIGPELHGFGK